MKEQKQIKQSIIIYNIICYILLVCGSVYFHALYKKRIAIFFAVIFGCFYAVQLFLLKLEERHLKRLKHILVGSCLFASAAFSVIVVEIVSGNLFIEIQYLVGNFLIYSVIYFVLLFITRRLLASTVIGMLVLFVFTVANYYVTQFRGSPIVPSDFLSVGIAVSVMNTYHYEITWEMYLSITMILWWFTIVKTVVCLTGRMSRREVLHWTLPVTLIVATIIGAEFFLPNLDLWDLKNNIKKYGVAMSLVSNTKKMYIKAPEGYSYKNLELWLDEYKQHEESSQQKTPNIIVVMNESFADLTMLEPFMDSNIYMPYYNTLTNNTVKGTVLVSTAGGGTANTEYEFLTRNSMAFFPGMVPYQQLVKGQTDSLADDLKQNGYRAVALHPYGRYGYNRDKAYPSLGFDEFLDVTSFENPELERSCYVTDEESYKKIIEIFEATDEPLFVFNVTMQNHGGYETGFFGENVISIPGMEGEFPDVEEYLTLIKKSDEAFQILIDYFSQVEEPTIIVMFGDHQPKISEEFYENIMEKPSEELSLEEMQKKYEVPFFIWANYDIPEQENVYTSMNYLSGLVLQTAEMGMTPYQKFLLDLREKIPAMNMMGYLGDDGEWHYYYEENQYKELLDKYWHIQYNNVFAKRKSEEWFEE